MREVRPIFYEVRFESGVSRAVFCPSCETGGAIPKMLIIVGAIVGFNLKVLM